MNELAQALLRMHSPSAHRVATDAPIPAIFQDAPACRECRKAHPCPTAKEIEHHQTKEALHDARNR